MQVLEKEQLKRHNSIDKIKVRVYYEDTDLAEVVYYANYLKFCERARSEIFFKKGFSPLDKEGSFVVKSLSADYKISAKFADILDIETILIELKSASLVLEQNIFRDNKLLFNMNVKLVFISNGKIAKIPDKFVKLFKKKCDII